MAISDHPVPILEIDRLSIGFAVRDGILAAVEDFSLSIGEGEIVGLVGESGSGKTLVSLAVMGLLPPSAQVTTGAIRLRGRDLLTEGPEQLQRIRGKTIAMIFQDPMASLDPVFTCGDQLIEAILLHEPVSKAEARERARSLLEKVHIADPGRCMRSYPHELSGGQCQRVMIAMALSCNPALIIADEPTTALDVTVQAQVLKILREIQQESNVSILLITHDLGVISEITDRVAVLYAGRLMESASTRVLFATPLNPYTQALMGSIPTPGVRRARLKTVDGRVPGLGDRPAGCPFSTRCELADARCTTEFPPTHLVDQSCVNCWKA
jgi:peptide/nickel transport system ATP-binding protein